MVLKSEKKVIVLVLVSVLVLRPVVLVLVSRLSVLVLVLVLKDWSRIFFETNNKFWSYVEETY